MSINLSAASAAERRPLEATWCREALDVQNASNLSGVAHSLAAMCSAMASAGLDTEARASHPATRLFICKLADLAGINYWWDGVAERQAQELSGLTPTPETAAAA